MVSLWPSLGPTKGRITGQSWWERSNPVSGHDPFCSRVMECPRDAGLFQTLRAGAWVSYPPPRLGAGDTHKRSEAKNQIG